MAQPFNRWNLLLGALVTLAGTSLSIGLAQYAEADDAPGGVVIAMFLFVLFVVGGIKIANQRPQIDR